MKRKLYGSLSALTLSIGIIAPTFAQAATIANGDLYFHGWQSDTKIYSEIGNNDKYMVRANVHVGGSTYTSGYQSAYAIKSAARVWYANESATYNYYKK